MNSPLPRQASIGVRDAIAGTHQPTPLLVPIPEARRQLGRIGSTAFYEAVKRHRIELVRLGGRSLCPTSELERVVAELRAVRPSVASENAKALARRSVASRRARRGQSNAPDPPQSP